MVDKCAKSVQVHGIEISMEAVSRDDGTCVIRVVAPKGAIPTSPYLPSNAKLFVAEWKANLARLRGNK